MKVKIQTALQSSGSWETRVFEFDYNADIHNDAILAMQEFIGINLSEAKIELLSIRDLSLGQTYFDEWEDTIAIRFGNEIIMV